MSERLWEIHCASCGAPKADPHKMCSCGAYEIVWKCDKEEQTPRRQFSLRALIAVQAAVALFFSANHVLGGLLLTNTGYVILNFMFTFLSCAAYFLIYWERDQ